jgi:hypothetical protein
VPTQQVGGQGERKGGLAGTGSSHGQEVARRRSGVPLEGLRLPLAQSDRIHA